jgi:hypothetical protein
MVFLSSYFITGLLERRGGALSVIYFLLIAFANIVLTFEILSLFSAITPMNVLIFNAVVLVLSFVVRNKACHCEEAQGADVAIQKSDCFNWIASPLARNDVRRFWNALKLDKYLLVLAIGFAAAVGVSVILACFMPLTSGDAYAYHVARSAFWAVNGNLNHFVTADSRNLMLPINSEILYTWIILFTKKLVWFGFVTFAGFILLIVSLYNMMSGFSMRRKLWVIFILTSFPAVIANMTNTETDIIIAGLISASLFLFWLGVKEKRTIPVFMSALAYALAIGTKTTALLAIPAAGFAMLVISMYYKSFKPLLKFLGFAAINFLIFSSYNYILNFINYGDISGSYAFATAHKNPFGIKSIPANFIKYMFMYVDFTGFRWANSLGEAVLSARNSLLEALPLSNYLYDGLYSSKVIINFSSRSYLAGLGILGMILYFPCWVRALAAKPNFKRGLMSVFAIMLLINILVMSYQLQFMVFSIRFFAGFCLISAPVIAYSYCKKNNPYKFIVVCFAMFYLLCVSTHLWERPFNKIVRYLAEGRSMSWIREYEACFNRRYNGYTPECILNKAIAQNYKKSDKMLIFMDSNYNILIIGMLKLNGYNIDLGLMEDIENTNLEKYDYIITNEQKQYATNILHYDERKRDGYVLTYRDHPCFYDYSTVNPWNYPFGVTCNLRPEFYESHNYKPYSVYRILTGGDKIDFYVYKQEVK